jgi:hypothetical protein
MTMPSRLSRSPFSAASFSKSTVSVMSGIFLSSSAWA